MLSMRKQVLGWPEGKFSANFGGNYFNGGTLVEANSPGHLDVYAYRHLLAANSLHITENISIHHANSCMLFMFFNIISSPSFSPA